MKQLTGIKVFAPATINGLGQLGEDILGLALENMGDEVIVKHSSSEGLSIKEVYGAKGQVSKIPTENPASQAANLLLQHLGREKEGIEMEIYKRIPLEVGLGSKEASAVAGILAVNELLKRPLEKRELLPLLLSMNLNATHLTAALEGGVGFLKENSIVNQRISMPRGFYFTLTSTPLHFQARFKGNLNTVSSGKRLLEFALGCYNSNFETLKRVFQGVNGYEEDELGLCVLQQKLYELGVLTSFVTESTIVTIALNSLIAEQSVMLISSFLKEKKIRNKSVVSNLLLEGAFKY